MFRKQNFKLTNTGVNYSKLQVEILKGEKKILESKLHDREKEVEKLQVASEKLNSKHQNRHEIDSAVIQKVMQQAGEWHQQVKQLKKKNTALMLALPTAVHLDLDATDAGDAVSETSGNEEVDFLKRIISEMSEQVAALQTDAKTAKLSELEAHESTVQLTQELKTEKEKCAQQAKELQELRNRLKRHNRVSKLLMEMSELNIYEDKDRQMAETKLVMIQKHLSALLPGEHEVDERRWQLLEEVDAPRDARQQQAARHRGAEDELQLKTAEKHEDTDILLSEEKTILAEEDVQKAQEVVEELKVEPELLQEPTPTPPPSPTTSVPAPPPSLPPPPAVFQSSSVEDMAAPSANKGPSLKKTKQNEGGAMDAIVDQTKGVTFQLKSTDQNSLEKPKDDQPGGRGGGAADFQHLEGKDESEE